MLLTIGKDSGHEIIDYRELRLRLPYLTGDELASELDAGRIASFVNTGCAFEERRLPRHYDRKWHAWFIDEDEAREHSFLFKEEDVRRLEEKYPSARPNPELRGALDLLPDKAWMECKELPDGQGERIEHFVLILNAARERVASLQAEIAEKDGRIAELKAKLAERGASVAALEAKPAEEDKPAGILPCIGDGFRKMACELLRAGCTREVAAAKLHESKYKPSDTVVYSLLASTAMLEEKHCEGVDGKTMNKRRGTAGGDLIKAGQRLLDKGAESQPKGDSGKPSLDYEPQKLD